MINLIVVFKVTQKIKVKVDKIIHLANSFY